MDIVRHSINDETKKRMDFIKLFGGYGRTRDFIYNIEKQGWISSRQMVAISSMYAKTKDAITPRKGDRSSYYEESHGEHDSTLSYY